MPYIHPEDRVKFDDVIDSMPVPASAGELNYVFTRLAKLYVRCNGGNYQSMNDVMGALTGAQAEFYRRDVAPYEDAKRAANGDVR